MNNKKRRFATSRRGMPGWRVPLSFLLTAFTLLALSSTATAGTVAANGFSPADDGYSFRNFGIKGVRGLTSLEMRKLFGHRVCASIDAKGRCTLTPEAEQWMEATNSSMAGGHCFGMATTAQLFFMGIGDPPSPEPFGALTTPGLVLDGNPKLQSHIAYAWTLQTLPSVSNAAKPTTPIKLVEQLRKDLAPGEARHVLTIFHDGAGHGVTPVAIEDDGNDMWRIAIYDNNWPGETRYVSIDGKKNTWTYELIPGMVWSGNAKSKSIGLANPELGLGRQPCFICPPHKGKPGSNVGKTMRLMWQGNSKRNQHGSLWITDEKGKRSGCGPAGCVNRIPGARMHRVVTGAVKTWRQTPTPVFELPTRKSYAVKLGATGLKGRASESVSLVGRGFSVSAEGIHLRKGETDTVKVAKKARRILFVSGSKRSEKPTIEVTSSNVDGGASYKIEITPAGVDTGAGIAASLDPVDRVLRLENLKGQRFERVKLEVTRYAKQVKQFEVDVKVKRGKVKKVPLS